MFIAAQAEAIRSGKEKVNAELLRSVWRKRFQPLHKIVEALRLKDHRLLSRYDDLYTNAFSHLKQDPLLDRLDVIKGQIMRHEENHLGIDLPPKKRVASRPNKATKELAASVTGSSLALPGILT
ncbi:MAG TPA: hypothetical protein VF123_16745 [Candidatus Sulfotelmatobacter sp.]